MAKRQVLSREEIMHELDAIVADFAFLQKISADAYNTSFWREERYKELLDLERRIRNLHVPICNLEKEIDRVKANTIREVLLKLIML